MTSRKPRLTFGKILSLLAVTASFLFALLTSLSITHPDDLLNDEIPDLEESSPSVTATKWKRKLEFSKDISVGILSQEPKEFFQKLQWQVDTETPHERCKRYGYQPKPNPQKRRRLYLGSLIADEPWELIEIVSTESYGIYSGIVFVESNRTQNFDPRPVRRTNHIDKLETLFGVEPSQLQVRLYVNEKPKFTGIRREHAQRQEILRGWRELGMTHEDVGIIADADETFSRDFLRAAQECDIPHLDYSSHQCYTSQVKLAASSRVYETSPECVTASRGWYHPEMIIGHCIEMIGNRSVHPIAFRDGPRRAHGYGRACSRDFSKLTGKHPLWSAADFRMLCGQQALLTGNSTLSNYTGFHFHNFFTNFNATRAKYHTYGHAVKAKVAFSSPLDEIGKNDLTLMYRCVRDVPDDPDQKWKRVLGGFNACRPPVPLYFHDIDYRNRRHSWVKEQVRLDDQMVAQMKVDESNSSASDGAKRAD